MDFVAAISGSIATVRPPRAGRGRLTLTVTASVGATAAVVALVASNASDVGQALALTTFEQVAALVVLHLVALVLRAEAWGLCLAAAAAPGERRKLHATNSFRFLAETTVPTYIGAWVRIAILRKLDAKKAPTIGQMITADGTLLLVETFITVGLLVACSVRPKMAWCCAL